MKKIKRLLAFFRKVNPPRNVDLITFPLWNESLPRSKEKRDKAN